MPTVLKIILTLGVLWSTVYSASYAAFQLTHKKHKSGIAALVLVIVMLTAFTISGILRFFP